MAHVQTVLGQRYELQELVGRGAMGVVYRARDRVLGRDVAVKMLALERSEDPTFVARFEREALAVARLSDPRIVMVYDSGREEETRFFVMEFIRGRSLAQIVREDGPLPVGRAVEIGSDIAGALAVAHRAGIIHRDVKPANVMVDERGAVKVLDFGIAKAAAGVSLTHTATVLGSAPYLAPEVIRGGRADERSDVYSLGCVLYELVSGRPPFTGENPAAVLHQHDAAAPRALQASRGSVPGAFEALVMQMLAKDPRSRPRSAEALTRALPASLGQPRTAAGRPSGAASTTEPTRALRAPRRRFSRGEAFALGVALAITAAGLVFALTAGSSGSRATKADAAGARRPAAHARRGTTRASSKHAHTTRTTVATKPTRTQTQPPPTQAAGPPTVAGAAGGLTSLVTADYEHGALDQQAAQQILGGLHDVLNSYETGNTNDAAHHTGDLTKHVEQLAEHGDIEPSALPAITGAVGALLTAVEHAPPPPVNGPGTGPPAGPKQAGVAPMQKAAKAAEPPGHHSH